MKVWGASEINFAEGAALTHPSHTSSHFPHTPPVYLCRAASRQERPSHPPTLPHTFPTPPLKPLQGSVPPEVIQAAGAALSTKQQAAFQAYMAGQVPEAADE